ncbi:hypothetical protein EYS14_10035 [Alteromonadaceae bacterium M269]|nr:hypothetical protein EYS14_10035 [Alteromonadaceae bacterium M269]
MNTQDFIHLAFLSQVILLSYYFPRVMLKRTESIMERYSQEEYPKLYPVPVETIRNKIAFFRLTNGIIFLIGVASVVITKWVGTKELLTWDNQAVIALYFMLQASPMIWATLLSMKYGKQMHQQNQTNIRKAALSPRKFRQYIPTGYLVALIASHLLYFATVFYFIQNPFDGFAGYINLLGLLVMDILFGSMTYYYVFVRKGDPVQTLESRNKETTRSAHLMVAILVAVIIKITLDLVLSGLGLRDYQDIVTCIYFNLIVAFSVYHYRFDNINFELYRRT